MAIPVICPGCKTAFRVSDKFAGQTGPCPKCKAPIKIPAATGEVKVHGPDAGPKDAKGRPVFKPISRLDVSISGNLWLIGGGCALVALLAAWMLGGQLRPPEGKPADFGVFLRRGIGILLVTPGLCVTGYFFLRDREKLDVLSGRGLWLRTAICTACYLVLWAGYAYVRARYNMPTEVWQLFIILPPMLVLGAFAALGCYELDFGTAFLHYCFHVLVIVVLAYAAGMKMWPTMV
jgi:hypothetical protein